MIFHYFARHILLTNLDFVVHYKLMGKYAVITIGPAGGGKTTFCDTLKEFYENTISPKSSRSSVHVLNFDPATSDIPYPCAFDIRDEMVADDVQNELNLGPNGALVHCMEELLLMDKGGWFSKTFGMYEDDFVIIDMPGQIELIAQIPVIPNFIERLKRDGGYKVVVCFLLDAQAAVSDRKKFISACMCALSAMVAIEVPFLSFLTKVDLLPREYVNAAANSANEEEDYSGASSEAYHAESALESTDTPFHRLLSCDFEEMQFFPWKQEGSGTGQRLSRREMFMNRLCGLLTDFSLVSFHPWSACKEKTVRETAALLDYVLEVHEDEDVHDKDLPDEHVAISPE